MPDYGTPGFCSMKDLSRCETKKLSVKFIVFFCLAVHTPNHHKQKANSKRMSYPQEKDKGETVDKKL